MSFNCPVNYTDCPHKQKDPSSLPDKCTEYCGRTLRRTFPKVPLALALTALVAVGGSYFTWKQFSPKHLVDNSNTANQPIPGTQFKIYTSLANVPNVPKGIFNYGGSTTFAPLRSQTVVDAINKAHSEFQLRYTEPTIGKPGSGKGIEMLLEGQLSFSQSSRGVKDEEFQRAKNKGFQLEQVPVAIDGIAFYVNPDLINQGLKGITLEQARGIFTGKITNWKEVGGPNLEIIPFSRNLKDGGTVDFVHEKVLEKQDFGTNIKEIRDTTQSLRKVASTPGGIGYATASEVINQHSIRILAVAKEANLPFISPCSDDTCTAVNRTDFIKDTYPITRRLFVVIKRDGRLDEQAGVAYANMLLSDEGQKLVEQASFVALR
jgi:phosphate transport system substrate-binding protein